MPDIIWPHYSQTQKDQIAATISKWRIIGRRRTTGGFHILMLSFLKKNGLPDRMMSCSRATFSGGLHTMRATAGTLNRATIITRSACLSSTARSEPRFGDEHYPQIAEVFEEASAS